MNFVRIVVAAVLLSVATAGFSEVRLEASLGDAWYQSDDQWGLARLTIEGTRVDYEIELFFSDMVFGAVITRPTDTVVRIDLHPTGALGGASGSVTGDPAQVLSLATDPTGFVLRVSCFDAELVGALRYADGSTPGATTAFLPLVARNHGQAGSVWRTDLHLTSLTGVDAAVTLDYFPMNGGGSEGPAASRTVTVAGDGQLILRDVLGTLFDRDGERGAMRLTAASPFAARARLYNVPAGEAGGGAGALSLYSRAYEPGEIPAVGALPGLSNRAGGSNDGFRTNLIVFNPTDEPIEVAFVALFDDGDVLGVRTLTVGPWANDVASLSGVFDGVEQAIEEGSFLVKYVASGPLIVQAAEIDGAAGDGVLIEPVALLGGGPRLPPAATLPGTWNDSMALMNQNAVTVCGKTVSWDEMDVNGEYEASITRQGAGITLCYVNGGGCLEGEVQGNRLLVSRSLSNDASSFCGVHELTASWEQTIDLTIESETVMRGTGTWKITYSGGLQQPVEHITTVSHVMSRQ